MEKKRKIVIITGGRIEEAFALEFIRMQQPEYLLGVDRGVEFCFRHQITPDEIMGDFDSLPEEILDWYKRSAKVPVQEYNPVKDATDTMIALMRALELGGDPIWILGGTGSRIDHVLCNLQILKNAWQAGVSAWIVDSHNRITLPVSRSFTLRKEEQFGTYVSFFPLGETVDGLTLKGFKYPLRQYQLRNQEGLGVSNELAEDIAEVSWEKGILVMIQSRD